MRGREQDDIESPGVVDGADAAREAGLRYVSDEAPGIARHRAGKGFAYSVASGEALRDIASLKRIRSLAIPPAWTQVWICPHPDGHIQATGRDARGRKQYRYHPRWREVRDTAKYAHMVAFAGALPGIRARVAADLRRPGLTRERVLATVVQLLEATLIRVGNDDYARQNDSFGLTTLRDRHVSVEGSELRFRFKGKGGRSWSVGVRDRRVARVVRALQDLPGQELFQYQEADGTVRSVTSADVNAYLREAAGGSDVTAKDFRTWAGTVLAALALREFERFDSQAAAKRNVRTAIELVAARLGNTPTICRKCYVHPEVLGCYLDGELLLKVQAAASAELAGGNLAALRSEEAAVLALLVERLARQAAAETKSKARDGQPGRTDRKPRRRQSRPRRENLARTASMPK